MEIFAAMNSFTLRCPVAIAAALTAVAIDTLQENRSLGTAIVRREDESTGRRKLRDFMG